MSAGDGSVTGYIQPWSQRSHRCNQSRCVRQVSLYLLRQTLRRQQIHPERPTLTGRRTGATGY
ncbi:unnamed protein product [Tetraodon nigroviridis]|uniref:(spotted green pufferfish) hypothetical protein n=1 Tax=Tetraodon nigroviridis TaxID=99883 RepID=Q4SL51_TETNG|nr:unnamed protein product [Tetraodon nigroviridis]